MQTIEYKGIPVIPTPEGNGFVPKKYENNFQAKLEASRLQKIHGVVCIPTKIGGSHYVMARA